MTKHLNFENITFASSIAKAVRNNSSLYGKLTPNILKQIDFVENQEVYIIYGIKSKAHFDKYGFPHWDMTDKYSYYKFYGSLKKLSIKSKSQYFLLNHYFSVFNDIKNKDEVIFGLISLNEFKKLHNSELKEKTPEDTMTKKYPSDDVQKNNSNIGVVSYE